MPRFPPQNNLYRHIIYRARVTRLHRLGGQWQCFYALDGGEGPEPGDQPGWHGGSFAAGSDGEGGGGTGGQHRLTADFVVMATGVHSTPNIPPIEVRPGRLCS